MSASLSNIIEYFHDCYRSDNRELVIYDFLDRKIENKVFIEEKEELINNEYPVIPIDTDKASDILKKLEVFQKEKELLYGSFFVCGHYVDFKGETKRLCSPLFYFPADIQSKDELYYLSIRAEERRLNFPLISLLTKNLENDILEEPVFKQLSKNYIKFEDIGAIVSLFKKHFPSVEFEKIYSYPENISIKSVKNTISNLAKKKSSTSVLLPTSILGIVSKSANTRGVLNELKEISSNKKFSSPLKTLFNIENISEAEIKKYQKGNIPMILSDAQQALLKSSSINPLTLISGPPGTGKTYTIGAIAIEHMSRGESVLIASRTDEAVDVIFEKISNSLETNNCVVRGGKKRTHLTPLKRYLKALLTGPIKHLIREFNLPRKSSSVSISEQLSELSKSIDRRKKSITKTEESFLKEAENEIQWGKHLSLSKSGVLDKLKTQYLNLRNKLQTPIWESSHNLYKYDNEQITDILELTRLRYVAQVLEVLKHDWNTINDFHEALKLTSDTEKLNKFESIDFTAVLKAFPVWLTNLSEVNNVLPLKKELFDVVIIDEATQCDIASCLPLLQRAKRAVFAGDQNQLKHVSFLSRGIQNIYRNKHQLQDIDYSILNFRDRSILDLAMSSLNSGDQVAMLDEHFRSISPIISFSNEYFYDGALRVMTSRPDEKEQGVYYIQCNGKREKKGINEKEALNLLKDVRQLIDKEENLSTAYSTSIGILSPFRSQVDYLGKLVQDSFSITEIKKHKINIGTAYSFQGEERDNMYLSFVIDKDSHYSALRHINKDDVFNVSITRARNKQFVYTSITQQDLKKDSLLKSYFLTLNTSKVENNTTNISHDRFLKEVIKQLKAWGVKSIWSGFSLAGLKVDLLIKHNNQYIGIDLVGYPGEFEDIFGIERYRVLNRAGVNVFPLPYSNWFFEHDNTKKALKQYIYNSLIIK